MDDEAVTDERETRPTETTIAAFVGATGGAGTTRCTLEVATALAADGADVGVFDAAFATQGLAAHIPGQIEPDLTALLTEEADAPLSEGLTTLDVETAGRVAVSPAFAPFERFARAKTPDAAQRFETRLSAAADRFDYVLVDVPPVASNQAIAAVNVADQSIVVAPGTTRGADAVQQMRTRLTHVGSEATLVVSTRGTFEGADCDVPETDATEPESVPSCLGDDAAFTTAIVELTAAAVGRDVSEAFEGGGLLSGVERYVK
ncbi:cobq/cobb/mind/para nucleotide binding domain-containing protein [Halogeometricum borinquense DSM 11551]|uniref:CobQ/CobB/MinD/ParA nucleotide binding domain-containing protein n=2 Tax=Halogeometricum borinquense TaxID=60847 RepID=E4NRL7_HALBP|nr:AAA family ATPase [Halogeometricum borinquense]ADQ65693.1 CobQ/CobB/MinD/ParA nucleotide binding domain-containing protein [Halogeometricum borinquense DSM 11551]ELY27023.1 cobq/cobb/mind/para nucleotide binding domain-containing protein [Halogeometricum borinquense DSM 11551]RYJ15117.1 ParA family protein [Halogeometricum borinquense]